MGTAASHDAGPQQSVEVAPRHDDDGAIRRSATHHEGELPPTYLPGEVNTVYDAFQRGLRIAADHPCMGHREQTGTKEVEVKGKPTQQPVFGAFKWQTYRQVADVIDAVGSAIAHLGLAPPNDTGHRLVGLYSKNRWEWAAAQQALYTQNAASVPLYDTLGDRSVTYIIRQTGMPTIVCSKVETPKLVALKKADPAAFERLTTVVQFEDADDAEREAARASGLMLRTWRELVDVGTAHKTPHTPPAPTDLAVICYTSGTTGDPKGVMLSHRNQIADASNAHWADFNINEHDSHLAYLPLAHVFEQLVENALLMVGARIGFYSGDTALIMEDLKELRPTIFPSVPRLLNRIHDSIWAKAAEAGGVKAALFKQAFSAKQWWLKQNHLSHAVWDPLVFRPIAHHVGLDRCRLLLSASAPLSSHVLEFLRIVFSCQVVEGYGQTECGGACSVTRPEDQASLGHVGPPLACNEIKLVSLPDLGYRVTDTVHGEERDPASGEVKHPGVPCQGRGEIWVRGPNVFSAYYKDVDNTASTITPDGWMKSGDIGMWDARGRLCIIDRKKNMFKLSQGEYVAAEKVENECLTDWVQQIFVYGDSFHSMLVAIVVPNHDTLRRWAATHGKAGVSPTELLKDPELKASILKDMQTQGRARGLQGFEVPRDIYLEPTPWTPDDLLTPTFKLKRADAKKQYQEQIDALYGGLESVAGRKGMRQGKTG